MVESRMGAVPHDRYDRRDSATPRLSRGAVQLPEAGAGREAPKRVSNEGVVPRLDVPFEAPETRAGRGHNQEVFDRDLELGSGTLPQGTTTSRDAPVTGTR